MREDMTGFNCIGHKDNNIRPNNKQIGTDRRKKAAAGFLRRLCRKRERPVYFVTRSSHLTMANMANIEMAQTITKILHVAEIEMRL